MARQPLGRGLSALLGEESAPAAHGPTEIDIDLIDPNPEQPRTLFAESALEDLARSIRANGIVQPIVVRAKDGRYQIVAGERRWRAGQKAGLRKIPVIVKDIPDDKLLEIALVENIQRQELNPIEEANAFRRLIDRVGLTQETIADRVGKNRTIVSTSLRLLKLPESIQRYIAEGRLSAGHGRALLMTEDAAIQQTVSTHAMELNLSVRETERAVRKLMRTGGEPVENKEVTKTVDPNVKQAETRLMRHFSTNVRIVSKPNGKGGKIELEYYGEEDLNRIYSILMNK